MVDQVAGVQVVDRVAGAHVMVDQVAGAQVVVDQVAGAQVLVDLVTASQVPANRVAGTELLLNHVTPGDGYEFTHQVVQKEAKKWKLSFQTGVDNRVRVAGVFPFEGWNVCLL